MDRVRSGATPIRPVLLSEFLDRHPPERRADVRTGAWNVGNTSGYDFSQWAGTDQQRRAIEKIFDVSRRYWNLAKGEVPAQSRSTLKAAREIILEGETSCFLFWGDAWVPKLYEELLGAVDRTVRGEERG
jgi:alpha-amylase/alpha-mannosidase (GH57 family)